MLKFALCLSRIIYVLAGFDRVVFTIIVPPKVGKLRSFIISCSLLEKSKRSLSTVKCALIERRKTKNHCDQQGSHQKASGLQPGGVVVVTSSFSDSIVFAVHTRKTAFSNSAVFKSFHSGQCFQNDPFSVIAFNVVVWTIAVSGTKQYRFRLKTV